MTNSQKRVINEMILQSESKGWEIEVEPELHHGHVYAIARRYRGNLYLEEYVQFTVGTHGGVSVFAALGFNSTTKHEKVISSLFLYDCGFSNTRRMIKFNKRG